MTAPDAADQAAKLVARQTWERDRASLLIQQPFIALLAMHLDIVPLVDARLPTAATDGEPILVNPYFLQRLTEEERIFVLAHEVWHCALQHFARTGLRDLELWNVAVDHEVNAMLRSQQLVMPADAVYFAKWEGKNAEFVYAALDGQPPPPRGHLADVHDEVEDPPQDGKQDPDFGLAVATDVARRWPARVVAVAQQIERQHGDLPDAIAQLVRSLVRPAVAWQEVLRQFVTQTYGGSRTWLPPNRRHIHQGLYLPSRRDTRVELGLGIDSSASVTPYLGQFIAELASLLQSFGRCSLRVVVCDSTVQQDFTLDEWQLSALESLTIVGGGGTNFIPVFERLEDSQPQVLLFLTDGFGPAPSKPPPYPVLWVLTAGGATPAPWGQVVQLPALAGTVHLPGAVRP